MFAFTRRISHLKYIDWEELVADNRIVVQDEETAESVFTSLLVSFAINILISTDALVVSLVAIYSNSFEVGYRLNMTARRTDELPFFIILAKARSQFFQPSAILITFWSPFRDGCLEP